MKLLILTQYFPPETGAPQNRLFELALRLKAEGVDITVLTAMPNYPQMRIYPGYEGKDYHYEEMQGLKVHRSSIFVSADRSVVSRLRNYFSFVWSSRNTGKKIAGDFDFLLCESPPLFLGYTAMYLAKKKKAKLIFNVSDLWPESAEKLGVVTNRYLLSMAYRLEEKLYRRSVLVTGQTQGICESVSRRFPEVRTYWLPNGVDLKYYDPQNTDPGNWRKENGFRENDVLFLYAGIIGIAQGLEVILKAAEKFRERKEIKFILLGSGPVKEELFLKKEEMGLENVFFMDPVGKREMPVILRSVNVSIIPLRKLDLFKGAIPSKIFECIAMKIPVLLGVDGEARKLFIEEGKCGLYVEPEDHRSLADGVEKMASDASLRKELGENGRKYADRYFNRNVIAAGLLSVLNDLHAKG